jgi:hypothetical protein
MSGREAEKDRHQALSQKYLPASFYIPCIFLLSLC